ncbi:MAG: TonB-dependent receptor [Opitutaceae bacterium]|nr:TonB-dependent receptor [Opitutaceae bacterium]
MLTHSASLRRGQRFVPASILGFSLVRAALFGADAPRGGTPNPGAAAAGDQVITLSAFSVTGSNIRRLEVERALPVSVVTSDLMEARNAATPVELFATLPQALAIPINETNSGGATARGDMAAVSLRGVGSGNTLVLLNGRRVAAYPTFTQENSVPATSTNINQLPSHGLAQIDVLRDGASSVYGSDAVAGVVNYLTKKNYAGTEVALRFGWPEHGAGEDVQGTLTHGRPFAGGRGRWLSVVGYYNRNALYYAHRKFSREANKAPLAPPPFDNLAGVFNDRVGQSQYPSYRVGTATATTYFVPTAAGGLAFTNTAPARTGATADFFYNINPELTGLPRTNRTNVFNQVEYDLAGSLTAFGEISYYHARSNLIRYPIPYASTTDRALIVSADNPYNPYGSRFFSPTGAANADGTPRLTGAPQPLTVLSARFMEMGLERTSINSRSYRALAGLRGRLPANWTWESAAMRSATKTRDIAANSLRESLLLAAAQRTGATAYNPFGYTFRVQGGAVVADRPYVHPQSVVDELTDEFRTDAQATLSSVDVRASGDVFPIWSGAIALAAGGELRRETLSFVRAPFAGLNPPGSGLDLNNNDFIQASPTSNISGRRTVGSGYAELSVPLVAPRNDVPLVRSLEAGAAVRFEDYSDFGRTTKPKFSLNWQPAQGVMLRGSLNRGFRAPNLAMLYLSSRTVVSTFADSYRSPITALPADGNATRNTFVAGNAGLKPENSKGASAGIVVEVPRVKGLSFSVDYWRIRQAGIIAADTVADVLASDAALLAAATQAQLASGTALANLNLGSGTAGYRGDPRVVRAAAISAAEAALFAAYNAARPAAQQLGAVGSLQNVLLAYTNRQEAYSSGLDFGVNWRLPALPLGRLVFSSDWARLLQSYTTLPGSVVRDHRIKEPGFNQWRGTTVLAWQRQAWSASFSAYYISDYADTAATTTRAVYESLGQPGYIKALNDRGSTFYYYHVADSITYNAHVGYKFPAKAPRLLAGTAVRLGVVNLTDKTPPLTSDFQGYTPSVYNHLLPGRTWTLHLTREF